MRTRIRMRELEKVFASKRGDMMHGNMVRLAVLYEDLRIELMAIVKGSIRTLDSTDKRYRKHYFLRRSIATSAEFAETIRLLDACSSFRTVKLTFDKPIRKHWDETVMFFKNNERF